MTTLLLSLVSLSGCIVNESPEEASGDLIAYFTWAPFSPLPGEDIQLQGKNLGDAKVTKWRWDFGGINITEQNPIVRMPELGPNNTFSALWVVLTIFDEESNTSKYMGIITTPRT